MIDYLQKYQTINGGVLRLKSDFCLIPKLKSHLQNRLFHIDNDGICAVEGYLWAQTAVFLRRTAKFEHQWKRIEVQGGYVENNIETICLWYCFLVDVDIFLNYPPIKFIYSMILINNLPNILKLYWFLQRLLYICY